MYSAIFRFSVALMMLDFFLCVIWLPIGVSKTYGFRSAKDVFTSTCGFLVAHDSYIFLDMYQTMGPALRLAGIGFYACECLCLFISPCSMSASLFTAGTMTGFDASGHIAEETKNAR